MLKVIELITGRLLIGNISILDEEPSLIIENSYSVENYPMLLLKYPIYADENNTLINSANILTIYTPNEDLTKAYLEKPQHTSIILDENTDEDASAVLDALYLEEEYNEQ